MLMKSNVYTPPPRTMMEVYQTLPEGTLAQLINNQIYMSPALLEIHQKILDKVYRQLGNFIEENNLGETRTAPYDVYLSKKNAFQPDIIFISTQNVTGIKRNGFYGAPDLVIEILSPASWRFDKEDKKDEYERSGVKEYWLIDPVDKNAEGFYLQGTEFMPLPIEKDKMTIKLLPLVIFF
jgi:Uma2 family endonuclease